MISISSFQHSNIRRFGFVSNFGFRASDLKIIFVALSIVSLPISSILAKEDTWQVTKSTHFIVHYINAKEDFVSKVVDKAEYCYNKIADDLGFRRYNFWLWDNRAKIYIYANSRDYQIGTAQAQWSSGCAKIKEKTIYTFLESPEFLDVILPHEIGHIIFREFVGFDNNAIPLWLDEGVACYQERLRRSTANKLIKEAIKEKNRFISLEGLFSFDPKFSQDTALINLFYAESLSIIDYLVKKFGVDTFISFCQGLRDKKDLKRALSYAYPFEGIRDLDKAWQKHLTNE